MAPFFDYELTTIPTYLFNKDNGLRKTDKAQLARALKKSVEPSGTKFTSRVCS